MYISKKNVIEAAVNLYVLVHNATVYSYDEKMIAKVVLTALVTQLGLENEFLEKIKKIFGSRVD